MKIDRLILRDVFAFQGTVDLNVGALGEGVFAIVGENGRGKTAIIETVPAVTYQQLPGHEDAHPKTAATGKASKLEYWYSTDAGEQFRALLSLDGDTGATDGLLERVFADGREPERLNDGKVSTLRRVMAERFPSYELFINSVFAAQGRGDEFARTKPAGRKELFAEFIGLASLLAKAETARKAAVLCEIALDRLRAVRSTLAVNSDDLALLALHERETQLEADAHAALGLKTAAGQAVADLEGRVAVMQDAVAAHGAAMMRIRTLRQDLDARRAEQQEVADARAEAERTLMADLFAADRSKLTEMAALDAMEVDRAGDERTATSLAEIDAKLAGNKRIQEMRPEIEAAVAAIARAESMHVALGSELEGRRTAQAATGVALRLAEKALAALAPVEQRHSRATSDAALIARVPCQGAAPFDGCELLANAQAAQAGLADLVAQLEPMAALADRVAALLREAEGHVTVIADLQAAIQSATELKAQHAKAAGYAQPLESSDVRIAELTARRQGVVDHAADVATRRTADIEARRARAVETTATVAQAAQDRFQKATEGLDARAQRLAERLTVLEADLAAAEQDLAAVTEQHQVAADLQFELTRARAHWDAAVAALAGLQQDLAALAGDRLALAERRAALAETDRRIAQVEQAVLDWRSLAKDLGKGGLADLLIDQAGPTITATANVLLLHAADARFSLDIVTQTERSDGDGMKDHFTVLAMDNADARGWRDLKTFSGGQRTLIQEALMLAIAMYVNERSAQPIRTLFRDETGSALDADAALKYVAMLRKAREIGRFWAVFFISHNAEAAATADAQIVVADGTASIVLPPYAAEQRVA